MANKLRWFTIVLVLGTAIIGIGILNFWQFRLKRWAVFEKTRYGNMRSIAAAVGEFARDRQRIPADLREMVQGGYLPDRSSLYRCPLLHNSLRDQAISYLECEFNIRFEPNQAVVSLTRSAIDLGRLSNAPARLLEWRVDKSGNMTSR